MKKGRRKGSNGGRKEESRGGYKMNEEGRTREEEGDWKRIVMKEGRRKNGM